MTRTTSTQITKSESNARHCRNQEVAQGSDKQNSTANRTNNRGKTIKTPVELNEEYQVKNILEQRMISGKTHYLVK